MTEPERIIREGILPASFFENEVRADYLVESKRKRIWSVGIDLLVKFQKICKKYNLTWYLMFGTLLGAVRHHGFIPWDDDVDIAMPRKDYEVLCSLSHEFSPPYFLQTPETDPGYFYSYVKLRNSNTTCLSPAFSGQGYNQGIMIDIFCVDYWNAEAGEETYNQISQLIRDNSNFMRKTKKNPTVQDIQRMNEYSGRDPMKNCLDMNILAKRFQNNDYNCVCLPLMQTYGYKNVLFSIEDFSTCTVMEYEKYFYFPVPIGYDRILRKLYGEYSSFPPLEKRGTWHLGMFDPDVPYTKYIEKY